MILLFSEDKRCCYRVLFIFCVFYIFPVSQAHAEKPVSIDISINFEQALPLNKNIFGVHGELLWSKVRYEAPLLANNYQELGFTSIRLPGGTTANYYLSETANFGCKNNVPKSSKSADRINKFNTALSKKKRSYSTEDFTKFLNSVNTDVSLVANVLCDTPDSTERWLKKFKKAGVNIDAVEMGNELYYPESQWAISGPDDYIQIAGRHAEKVKQVYPDAKIGLIASSFSFKSKMYPNVKRMRTFDRLARGLGFEQASAKASFADALVIHLYSKPDVSRLDEMKDVINNHRVYITSVSHFDSRLKSTIDYLQGLSKDKELWVTEWGISFYGWLRKHEKTFEKSFYNSLFFANSLVSFSLEPVITRANYHNFTDFLSKNKKAKAPTVAEVMFLFKDVIKNSQLVSDVTITGVKEYTSFHEKYKSNGQELSSAFFSTSDKHELNGYLLIVNKFNTPYIIRSTKTSNGKTANPAQITRLVAERFEDDGPGDGVIIEDVRPDSQGFIEIPPYSITRIKYQASTVQ